MYLDTNKIFIKLSWHDFLHLGVQESIPDKLGINPISRSPNLVDVYAAVEVRELLELLMNKGQPWRGDNVISDN